MPKIKRRKTAKGGDEFSRDKVGGEYEKPGPKSDPEAAQIAAGLSKIAGRAQTGYVLSWLPLFAKRAKVPAFSFFFFDDKLAVDSFNRDRDEMDALQDDLTQEQKQEIAHKTVLCAEHGIGYLPLGPDDELDMVQLASKIGKTTFKRGGKQLARKGAAAEDGISEEDA